MTPWISEVDPIAFPADPQLGHNDRPLTELFTAIRADLTQQFAVELRGNDIWIGVVDNRDPMHVRERLSRAMTALSRQLIACEYREGGTFSCLIVRGT